MSPPTFCLYVVATGVGLFVCWLLALVGMFLFVIGKGQLAEMAKKAEKEDREPQMPSKRATFDWTRFAIIVCSTYLAGFLLLWLGSNL